MGHHKRLLTLLAVLTLSLASSTPVLAGGWATTLLDPLPAPMEAGHSYTVGFWILQHGSHVSMIPLTAPGLQFADADGHPTLARGVALPEGGHYAAAVVLPHNGRWTVTGMQAPFQDYEVGVLDLPGQLTAAPTPAPLPAALDSSWSTVRPPNLTGVVAPGPAPALTRAAQAAATSNPGPWLPLGAGILVGLGIAVLILSATAVAARRRESFGDRLPGLGRTG